jgi:hypothetical protein
MRKLALLCILAAIGCSSESTTPPTTTADTGTAADTSTATDTESPGDAVAADDVAADAAKPVTPEVVSVAPMAGAWHVTWRLNDTGLTKVELWRTNDGAAATLVKAFAGTAKDWHDGAATGTIVKYCYTVKTFRGTLESSPSAEKCSK